MPTCSSCGRHVEPDFPFCPYCRAELTTASPSREQRKRVTILFCDVTASTALGESTDPEALRALLARYFERMKGIIERHGGTVEKFIGDAVMAVFGVPVLHEDDALRAVRAASEMQGALPELGISARIGINSGEVVTGTAERLATGDAVNVAARLEQAAPPGEVLIGEETLRLVRDAVEVVATERLALKGKHEPVPAYQLLAVKDAVERRQSAVPMIGRERELERLRLAFAQAVDDRSCQLFTVLGAAGVGKSRLALEFLNGLSEARIVRGRCLSYGEGITYWPVVEVIEQLDALPADPYARAALQSLLGESSAGTTAEEIAWGFRKLLEAQAQEQPLIVVFDDIHWGEQTLLDLIEHIADLSRDAPILLLCMARPDLLEKRPTWGGGKWNATTVLLEPLSTAETELLVDALGGLPDKLRERISQAAEGNPLFVEEMLSLIRESQGTEVAVPPTIQALLAARLDQLGPDERSVLECGSVEGRVFHRSAVQVLSHEGPSVQGKLVGLVRKELVRPERSDLPGDEAYRFRHLLIRDAAYDALPKSVRAELHDRFVDWLEKQGEGLVELDEIVGYHLEQAATYAQELGQPNEDLALRAAERLVRAGRQAWWREDTRTAAGLLERALVLTRPFRLDIHVELDLLDNLDLHLDDRLRRLETLAERARAAGDRRGEILARMSASATRFLAGDAPAGHQVEALAQEAIPLLEELDDHRGLVRILVTLGELANARGHFEERARSSERAIYHAEKIGWPGVFDLPQALVFGPRPADEALRTLDSLLVDVPSPYPRQVRTALLAMLGHTEEARAEALALGERLRDLTGTASDALLAVAYACSLAEDHEAAASYMRLYCDYLQERGLLANLSTYAPQLGRSLCRLGRYDEAEPLAQRGRELGAEDDLITQALWREVQARVLAHRGELEEAQRLAREAVAITDQMDDLNSQGDALIDLAEVLEAAGRGQEAQAALLQALDRYERKRNLAMADQVQRRLGGHSVPPSGALADAQHR
jgi:class 3 adenylate cyclase/tetratricopeptide (TPR) repeat protein